MKPTTFDEFLKGEHAEEYHGTDDDMPDAFDAFMSELSADEFIAYADKFAKARYLKGCEDATDFIEANWLNYFDQESLKPFESLLEQARKGEIN